MADYIPNDEAAQIAEQLIQQYHPRLIGLKIAHLLRLMPVPKPKKNPKPVRVGRKIVLAKAAKVSPKVAAIAGEDYKFVIEYGSLYWDKMEPAMKIAIVDHELGHCGNDADGTYTVNHDLEDFRYMLVRHGAYKSDVEDFVNTVLDTFTQQETASESAGN